MAWIFITSLLAALFLVGAGYFLKKDLAGVLVCLFLGLFCLVLYGFISNDKGFNTGKKIGIKMILRARLNEPIDDISGLYGYEVLNKSYFKERINDETPEEAKYLLKLEDRISAFRIVLDKVEVSEEVYNEVESSRIYPEELEAELKSRLRDPNDPSPP